VNSIPVHPVKDPAKNACQWMFSVPVTRSQFAGL
jgi:hypothetical protein